MLGNVQMENTFLVTAHGVWIMNASNINVGTLGEEQEFYWSYKEVCVPFLIKPPKR